MKNFAKLNEFEFYLMCGKKPTDLCKQENNINIFDFKKVILIVGQRLALVELVQQEIFAAVQPKGMICDGGGEGGFPPSVLLKWTEQF